MPRHPSGYWTKERCIESAKKYNTITEWSENEGGAYFKAHYSGWIDDCCSHMRHRKPNGYYTKKICLDDARKYQCASDWMKASPKILNAAHTKGWYAECTAHMTHKLKYTDEMLIEIVRKYKTKKEWINDDFKSYAIASSRALINKCTVYMKEKERKPRGYWTKERCLESASKYVTVTAWERENQGAYGAAWHHGWFKECTEIIHKNKPIIEPKMKNDIVAEEQERITSFLKKNGFQKKGENTYTNDKCKVVLTSDYGTAVTGRKDHLFGYHVIDLYWLIGYLTAKRYIDSVSFEE